MPDIHWGYGFPIGGVAATDPAEGGIILQTSATTWTPSMLACCSTLTTELTPKIESVVAEECSAECRAASVRAGAIAKVARNELDKVMTRRLGGRARLRAPRAPGSDRRPRLHPRSRSGERRDRARERGLAQIGTLGSGNHFLELGVVEGRSSSRGGRLLAVRPAGHHAADPHRLARLRLPGLRRLPEGDGAGGAQARHPAS